MKVAFDPAFVLPLPDSHRFPMEKYELIPEQLLYEGILTEEHFIQPQPVKEKVMQITHHKNYIKRLKNLNLSSKAIRKIGFPLSKDLIKREFLITGATTQLCKHAFQDGIGLNVAGGTHHALPDSGEGFCMLNDVAVAANYLLSQQVCERILIIDLDVHHGNGTAKIFEKEDRVFTFSMHGENNYPMEKPPSDLDIPLPDKTIDTTYLKLLQKTLPGLIKAFNPDFLFYIAGADVLETDRLGKLSLTLDGARQRDQFVFELAQNHQLPIVVTMGGGYSRMVRHIVTAHCNTFRLAQQLYN